MQSFVSVIDLLGNVLLEEQLIEDDRKYEGCCVLLPHELAELWDKPASPSSTENRSREGGYVRDPWKDVVRSSRACRFMSRSERRGRC